MADHDVNFAVFHGGIEDFFDLAGKAVDFVDEQHGVWFEVGEDADEVTRSDDGGAGGDVKDCVHLGGNNMSEGCFPESGRAVKEEMIEGFFALFGRLEENTEVGFDGFLANKFGEAAGTEGEFVLTRDDFGVHLVVAAHFGILFF